MTYILLSRGGYRESNPIANWFIAGWGVKGMVDFKFALVAVVTVIAQIVAARSEKTARWLLIFGTVVVGFVVACSLALLLRRI